MSSPVIDGVPQITPLELKERLDKGDRPFILDVRNLDEVAICRIPGTLVIPLPELPQNLDKLNRDAEIIIHCKSGGRSTRAAQMLQLAGFPKVCNLTGGILAWIRDVDPSQKPY